MGSRAKVQRLFSRPAPNRQALRSAQCAFARGGRGKGARNQRAKGKAR